ncbi:DNA polymerase III subunit gamma and tau [Zafaria sp. Z1313]|uniref:DNA polymerase III subunit gamma and tau n=1 Tax=Zafaria sp. Z1313 TaxID=3423202 RepID=UPI003D30335E
MSTALYRRYRPDAFADVIGQEHVTTPLMSALEKNRVNHAYLFSGPRGCGKTTSARILARCLNCAQGPTPTPCGACESCVELATGGPGSLDVIEIDAASHGGVDDARDLRERATFAPVRDRYKIFIIDEAHMVTSAGFNALLKIVEEPPEHIKFIFATTEPDKVIGTIRSRTHHYPFRLVPPEALMAYLEKLCTQEGVPVAPGVLSLVVRAGGGSVRDSLSVLDQLIAGAGPSGLDYELAVSLLGYTHASLLDDVVDAMAAQDAATVFGAVDRVIQTGHDPRRFVEDLLERFRDLIIVKAMPDNAAQIIRGLPEDQLNRMRQQATQLGQAELSRSADVTNQALTDMTGATSPRLHLELLCARLLLPASDAGERGTNARIDRIERRLAYGGGSATVAGPGTPEDDAGSGQGAVPSAVSESASPREQGAAQVREALRAARGQGGTAAPAPSRPAEEAPVAIPAAAASTAPTAPAVPGEAAAAPAPSSGAGHPARQAPAKATEAPGSAQGRDVPTPGAAAPAGAAPEASTPAAPRPEPSPDWGGTWGAVPDPGPEPKAPAASGQPTTPAPAPAAHQTGTQGAPGRPSPGAGDPADTPGSAQQRTPVAGHAGPPQGPAQQDGQAPARSGDPAGRRPVDAPGDAAPSDLPAAAPTDAAAANPAQAGPGSAAGSVEMFRRAWPEIMDKLKTERKFVWMAVQPNASVAGYDGRTLTVAFANQGALTNFSSRQDNIGLLQWCIHEVLGVKCEVVVTPGGSAPAGGSGPKADRRPTPAAATPTAPVRPEAPSAPVRQQGPSAPVRQEARSAPVPAPAPVAAPERRVQPLTDEPEGGWPVEPEDDGGYDWTPDDVPTPLDEEPPAPGPAVETAPAPPRDQTPIPPPAWAGSALPPSFQSPGSTGSGAATEAPASDAPAPGGQKRMSRYQQLLSQSQGGAGAPARTQQPAPAGPQGPGGRFGRPNAVDSTYVEDIPSDDDITIEESGVVGRPAIERILNGRLIEERRPDGSPIT